MDDCIEAQWELYIEYMRKTLDYNITLIPLTIIPLTPLSPLKCNVNAMTLHLKSPQNTHN
jgi:hypothetical protein